MKRNIWVDFLRDMTEEKVLQLLEKTQYLSDSECEEDTSGSSSSEMDEEEVAQVKKDHVSETIVDISAEDRPMETFQVVSNEEASASGEAAYSEHPEDGTHEMKAVPKIKEELGIVSDVSSMDLSLDKPQRVSLERIFDGASPSEFHVPGSDHREALAQVKKKRVYKSNVGTSSEDQTMETFQVVSNEEASTSSAATYSEHRKQGTHITAVRNQTSSTLKEESDIKQAVKSAIKNEPLSPVSNDIKFETPDKEGTSREDNKGPAADTNGMPRDACCALVVSHSECLNCCHFCNSGGDKEGNPEKHLIENTTQCLCKLPCKKRSLTECEVPFDIASSSEVMKGICERVDEEGEIERSGDIQRMHMGNEKSVYKNRRRTSGKNGVPGQKGKGRCPSLNTSPKQILQSPSGKKTYNCSHCKKTFNHESHLARHSGMLSTHMRHHTGEKPFKWKQCGKAFNESSNLTKHMRLHTGEKPFTCNECGKAFSSKSTISTHMLQHTGEKPFQCNDCGKAFGRSHHLTVHMQQHTGKKPFKCNECGKFFGQKSNLTTHMRTHTGEKPFKCKQCAKSFIQSSILRRHMRQHTGEKPFKCNECGKTFSQRCNLTTHMQQHTGEKPFPCNECGKPLIKSVS